MAFGAMTSLLGMIPLLAIGLNYYRYQNVDPENKVQEPQIVSYENLVNKIMELIQNYFFNR